MGRGGSARRDVARDLAATARTFALDHALWATIQTSNRLDLGCWRFIKGQPFGLGARSSAGEHSLHTGGVTGSIPVAPTIKTQTIPKVKRTRRNPVRTAEDG